MRKLSILIVIIGGLFYCGMALSACLTSPPYVFTYGQKPIPSGAINADFAGAYTNFTDCTWPAARVTVGDTGSYYATDTVESALTELAVFTGYNYAATATTSALRYIGYATGTASIVVAANLAPNGIIVTISSHMVVGANSGFSCRQNLPLSVNSTALASDGSTDEYRYVTGAGISAASLDGLFTNTIVYTPTDGWDPAITNSVKIGTAYNKSGDSCTSSTHDSDTLIIQAIK